MSEYNVTVRPNPHYRKRDDGGPFIISDPRFKYVPASATDVRESWKRYGWTPSEKRNGAEEHEIPAKPFSSNVGYVRVRW
jgi:hypothetical protein